MNATEYLVLCNRVGKTHHFSDNMTNVLLIRGARSEAERYDIISCIMDAHESRLAWLTTTQRKWQSETRNPNKARHHDSIAIRERYVRIGG